jgi:hypothetical protein
MCFLRSGTAGSHPHRSVVVLGDVIAKIAGAMTILLVSLLFRLLASMKFL